MVNTYSTVRQKDIQTDRQTDRQDRQKRMTNRPTNRQTDSIQYELKTDRCTERPIFTHMVNTYSTVRQKDIQTDRQTGQTEKNDIQTNKQTDRQYMSVV